MEQNYAKLLEQFNVPDNQVRKSAESEFQNQQKQDPEIALSLLSIGLNGNFPDSVKLQAITGLRRYISNNWAGIPGEGKCVCNIPLEIKTQIKAQIFNGLNSVTSKIKNSCASAISHIANNDWPEQWSEFCPLLEKHLTNPDSMTATLKVLSEFSEDICDRNLRHFVETFFQPLATMILDDNCGHLNKMYALEVFDKIFTLATNCDESSKKSMLSNVENTMDLVSASLKTPYSSTYEYFGFLSASVRLSTKLLQCFSKKSMELIPPILSLIWDLFNQAADIYCKNCIESVNDDLELDSDDDSGSKIGISQFIADTIEFIQEVQTRKRGRKLVEPKLVEIIAVLIKLSQISSDTLECWEDDIEAFQGDEDNCALGGVTVRASAQESLIDGIPVEWNDMSKFITALWQGVWLALERQNFSWQITEAATLTLNGLSGLLDDENEKSEQICPEQFEKYLSTVVSKKLETNENKFLTGRILIFGGKYCRKMSTEQTTSMLSAVSQLLQHESKHCKILAIRSLHSHIENLIACNRQVELASTIETNINSVLELAGESFKTELLPMCLEILLSLYEIDESTTAKYAEKTCDMLLILLEQNTDDPLMAEDVLELLAALVKNKTIADQVVRKVTPGLRRLLTTEWPEEDRTEMCVVFTTTVEAIEKIAKGSRNAKNSVSKECFSEFLQAVYLPAIAMAMKPDADSAVIQNCVDASKAIFTTSYGPELLMSLKSEDGKSYIEYVMMLVSSVLSPEADESAALNLGKLISSIVAKCGNALQEHGLLNPLLTACLTKLKSCDTLSVQQSLLLVFGQLMCENIDAVTSFVAGVGANDFFYALLCEKYPDFFGFLERKIGVISLSELLKSFISGKHGDLATLVVQGEEVFEAGAVRQTRRQAAGKQRKYTQIPLIVKLVKLCLFELQNQIDKLKQQAAFEDTLEDDEYEDYDDEDDDESLTSDKLDNILFGGGFIDDDDCFFDQVEVEENPFGSVDVTDHILPILKSQSFEPFMQHLTQEELETTKALGIL